MGQSNKSFLAKILEIENIKVLTLLTVCFTIWGISNNVTTSMVSLFSKVFRISTAEATLVPVAFSLGYFIMALPAAMFIQKHSYKWGVVLGLGIFTFGTLLFFPAQWVGNFYPFLGAYFILTCGLSFLETSCTPFIYSLGEEKSGIQRLNGAQAFNALGVVIGMLIVMEVHKHLSPLDNELRQILPLAQFNIIKSHDLKVLIQPYILIGAIVLLVTVIAGLMKMPKETDLHTGKSVADSIRELLKRRNYREGIITEFCYIGAQIGCWTYMVTYGMRIFDEEGMSEQDAEMTAEKFVLIAMSCFAVSRLFCTWLMHWLNPSRMLSAMGIIGMVALIGTIVFRDENGLYCIIVACGSFSLMFPTIYGIAVKGVGENLKIAAAGLTMTILGGSIFPPLQALIIQSDITLLGLPAINLSFIIPLLCIGVVVWYGHQAYVRFEITGDYDDNTSNSSTELARTEEHK